MVAAVCEHRCVRVRARRRTTTRRPCFPMLILAGALVATASCSTMSQTTPSSLVPLVPPDQLPLPSIETTTTAVVSSDPDRPLIATLPDGECAYAERLVDGEVTFVVGDRMYGASADGAVVRCLATLRSEQRGDVRWSPVGDRALVDGSTLLDSSGLRRSGFDDGSTRVVWEFPGGTGLISPSASSRSVVRRSSVEPSERADVTVLGLTTVIASHPDGGTLLAVGQFDDSRGLFATPIERAAAPTPLAFFEDPDLEVPEVAVDAAGDVVYLISDNGTQFRVHRFDVATLTGAVVETEQAPITRLTVGPLWRTVAWRVGLCNSTTSVRVLDDRTGEVLTAAVGTPIESQSLSPVGWLDSARLVVEARPLGCNGLADLWIWSLLDGSATLLARAVEHSATRTLNEPSGPLAIEETAQPSAL